MRNGMLHRPFFPVKRAAVAPAPSDRRSSRTEANRIVVGFAVKADSINPADRTFEGLASVWGKDLGDDNMVPGAFKKTIKEWKGGTDAIPLLNSHNHWDVLSAVGQLIDAKETTDGLWTKWEIIPGPDGDRILERIRPGSNGRSPVGKMSIGFEPMKVDFEASDTARFGQVRNLNEVRLKEVSLVLFPMAPGASIDSESVKSFTDELSEVKGDEVDDETKAALRKLASRIGIVLSAQKKATTVEPAEPKAKPPAPTATPTPPAPKAAAASQSTTEAEVEGDGETGTEGKKGGEGEDPPVDEHAGKYKFAEALSTRIQSVSKKAAITTS